MPISRSRSLAGREPPWASLKTEPPSYRPLGSSSCEDRFLMGIKIPGSLAASRACSGRPSRAPLLRGVVFTAFALAALLVISIPLALVAPLPVTFHVFAKLSLFYLPVAVFLFVVVFIERVALPVGRWPMRERSRILLCMVSLGRRGNLDSGRNARSLEKGHFRLRGTA